MVRFTFLISLFLIASAPTLQAEVIDTGDVILNGSDIFIGNSSFGSREVRDEVISLGVVSLGNAIGVSGEFQLSEGSYVPGGLSATDITIGSSGSGLLHSVGGRVSANSIVIGDAAGANGLFSANSGFLEQAYSVSSGSLIVGRAGSGSMTVSGTRTTNNRDPLAVSFGRVIVAEQAGSSGSLNLGAMSITNGYLGVGVGGNGALTISDAVYGNYADIRAPAGGATPALVELGVLTGAVGSMDLLLDGDPFLSYDCPPQNVVTGPAASVLVGVAGEGRLYVGVDNGLTVTDTNSPPASQIIVAAKPGSTGTVTLENDVFCAGFPGRPELSASTIRLGVDETGALGGTAILIYGSPAPDPGSRTEIQTDTLIVGANSSLVQANTDQALIVSGDLINEGNQVLLGIIGGNVSLNAGRVDVPRPAVFTTGLDSLGVGGSLTQGMASTLGVTWPINTFSNDEFPSVVNVAGTVYLDGTLNINVRGLPDLSYAATYFIMANGGITYGPNFNIALSGEALPEGWFVEPVMDPNAFGMRVINTGVPVTDPQITMFASPDPVSVGSNLSYQITVSNNGPQATLGGIFFFDTLPSDVTLLSYTPSQGTCSYDNIRLRCDLGDLAADASATIDLVVRVDNIPASGTLANTAGITVDQLITTDTDYFNNSASVTTVVTGIADVAITMTDSPDPVSVGSNLSYQITVSNNGPQATLGGIVFSDTLPSDVSLLSYTPSQGSCSYDNIRIQCDLGDMAANASATVDLVVSVNNLPAGGTVVNTAQVMVDQLITKDTDASNNSASVTTVVAGSADVGIAMTDSPDPLRAGKANEVTYDILVSNAGPYAAFNTIMTDVLPVEVTLISATASQGSCTGGATVTCAFGNLAAVTSATVTLVVKVIAAPAGNILINEASVTSASLDPDASNNTASVLTTIKGKIGSNGSNPEICYDGIDNDGDGKIDCADKKDCGKNLFCQ